MIENKNDIEEERDIKKEDYLNNSISSWEDLDLNPNILRGIYANGFEKPSPIQAKGISPMIQKKDIIAQAQSGTGKTGCFCLFVCNRGDTISVSRRSPIKGVGPSP